MNINILKQYGLIKYKMNWNGCWEIREGGIICQWMVAWIQMPFDKETKVGCVAGYSDGGIILLKKFFIQTFLWGSGVGITLEDNNYDDDEAISEENKSLAEDCEKYILDIHDQDKWVKNNILIMKPERVSEFEKSNDLYFGSNGDFKEIDKLFEKVGIKAINMK